MRGVVPQRCWGSVVVVPPGARLVFAPSGARFGCCALARGFWCLVALCWVRSPRRSAWPFFACSRAACLLAVRPRRFCCPCVFLLRRVAWYFSSPAMWVPCVCVSPALLPPSPVPPLRFPARSVRSPFVLGVWVALSSPTPGIAQRHASHFKYTALLFGISGCIYVYLLVSFCSSARLYRHPWLAGVCAIRSRHSTVGRTTPPCSITLAASARHSVSVASSLVDHIVFCFFFLFVGVHGVVFPGFFQFDSKSTSRILMISDQIPMAMIRMIRSRPDRILHP